jgi:hypothetical protein
VNNKIAVHSVKKSKAGITLEVVGGESSGTFLLPWNESEHQKTLGG